MSDEITVYCPSCGFLAALKKEHDELKLKLRCLNLKHPEDEDWYDSTFPIYSCSKCGKQWAIEQVND